MQPEWLAPASLEEALALKAERTDATVVAGGTFVGVLVNQRLLAPTAFLSLGGIPGLDRIAGEGGELSLGALATHRAVERSPIVREKWPALAATFALVASQRVRNRATVGGVLGDADYASDPPAMFVALGARVLARSARGAREIPVEELIVGHYETSLAPDELIVEVRVPGRPHRAVYRKFRTRSSEDRPCVGVAACRRRDGELRVVVGAVADRPQFYPELCDGELDPATVGRAYADAIDPMSDIRGSSDYRRRVIAIEVRRALEELGT